MARPSKGTTFWDRVYKHVVTISNDGCHLFEGCKDECGYGRIWKDGKLVRLHRAVWERDNGQIPLGAVICHKCDKPNCINPSHLFIGTQADNIKDMDKKGRRISLVGSNQPQAKLNESDIPEIRSRLLKGETCISIALEYGVSEGLIRHIKKGRAWRHVQ